jgi:anaerobic ribonucleoside-triphosphate reductase
MEGDNRIPKAILPRKGGKLGKFDLEVLADSILSAAIDVGGSDEKIAEEEAEKIGRKLYHKYGPVVTPDQINEISFDTLMEDGYDGTSWALRIRAKRKERADGRLGVLGSRGAKGSLNSFLMVGSPSKETSTGWDRSRIVLSLINEANLDLKTAESIAEEAETYIFSGNVPQITTQLIREAVHTELIRRDLIDAANLYRSFSIPRADLEELINNKITENANVVSNNPEAINFGLSGTLLKAYSLSCVFSPDVADAHSLGAIHLHDSDMPTRVYCSAHSLEYLKKYGLKLKNLNSSSAPPKHAKTLVGHANTFLASMQSYYAGALGLGDINVFFAPVLQKDLEEKGREKIEILKQKLNRDRERVDRYREDGRDVSLLEEKLQDDEREVRRYEADPMSVLSKKYKNNFLGQVAQEFIFRGSQNAFARGGQTLFLDFNIHTSVPKHLRNTPVILDGAYQLRTRQGLISLEERKLEERTKSGYNLMELIDPRNREVVLRERKEIIRDDDGRELKEHIVQERLTKEDERVVTYGDYTDLARDFTMAMLQKFKEGDERGAPFAFPKCDFHINEDSLDREKNPEDSRVIDYACEVASENGSVYIVMDRDDVVMSACCRLRTTIDDDYVLKHPEAMRFCGFQNVTINLPQAAYRAAKNGRKNLEGFLEEIDKTMDLVVKAHLQKKEFIEKQQVPGGAQHQTGAECCDGQKYVDTNKATYIIGLLGLNDAMHFMYGKELHEFTPEEIKERELRVTAHMSNRARMYEKKTGLKISLEESPAESATRRLSLIDLNLYPEETKSVVKGDIETGDTYYTNSIHLAPDAPVDLITRIKRQALHHPAITSGAITHAFVGEERPPASSIRNLVEKTFYDTQTAQLTISPEFTICESCDNVSPGLLEKCACGSEEVYGVTRIVGYFSRIPIWNPSKRQELKDRHKGNYYLSDSMGGGEMPSVSSGNGQEIIINRYGKPGCGQCKKLEERVQKIIDMYAKKGIHIKEVYHDVYTDDGGVEFLTARLNPSRLPAVVMMSNNEEVYRKETKYASDNGSRAELVTVSNIKKGIDSYLNQNANL